MMQVTENLRVKRTAAILHRCKSGILPGPVATASCLDVLLADREVVCRDARPLVHSATQATYSLKPLSHPIKHGKKIVLLAFQNRALRLFPAGICSDDPCAAPNPGTQGPGAHRSERPHSQRCLLISRPLLAAG